jgi:hypothetical protein
MVCFWEVPDGFHVAIDAGQHHTAALKVSL